MNKEFYQKYAKLAVKYGINLQAGQDVMIVASTKADEFALAIAEEAYLSGAKSVSIEWVNDLATRLKYQYESTEVLGEVLTWQEEKAKHQANTLPCKIYISDEDPDAFAGLDAAKMSEVRKLRSKVLKKYRDMAENKDQWTIIAIPSPAWAKKVFPNLDEEAGVKALWEAIIHSARLDGDVEANWDQHVAYLDEKASKMNALNLDYLTYKSSNGTDLTLKLQPNHLWLSAKEENLSGISFIANMPTEEVFTMPKRDGVNGIVYSTKPLSLQGQIVEDFSVTFENGKAIKVTAKKGLDVLESMLNMDESSRYLGEVALVPFNSPINETGLLFSNTLFDENACCHLAFGMAFKNNIKGYETMTDEDFKAVDFNDSMNHVDFMIGSKDLEIIGYDFEGKAHQIFKDGIWAL